MAIINLRRYYPHYPKDKFLEVPDEVAEALEEGRRQQYKPIRQKLDKVKSGKREKYQQEHRAELAAFDTAADFLKGLKESGEKITPKVWRAEAARLTAQKDFDYQKMRDMREDIKAVENLRKTADRLACEEQRRQREPER